MDTNFCGGSTLYTILICTVLIVIIVLWLCRDDFSDLGDLVGIIFLGAILGVMVGFIISLVIGITMPTKQIAPVTYPLTYQGLRLGYVTADGFTELPSQYDLKMTDGTPAEVTIVNSVPKDDWTGQWFIVLQPDHVTLNVPDGVILVTGQ